MSYTCNELRWEYTGWLWLTLILLLAAQDTNRMSVLTFTAACDGSMAVIIGFQRRISSHVLLIYPHDGTYDVSLFNNDPCVNQLGLMLYQSRPV